MSRRRRFALVLSLCLLAVACGEAPGDVLPDPRDGRSGVQLSGILQDRQIAISDGLPTLNDTDCDLNEGVDRDLCVVTEDISGEQIVIVFENPDVLVEGASLPIGQVPCGQPRNCDAVTDVALMEIRIGEERLPGLGGTLELETVVPGNRYRGTFDIELRTGQLSATFDLVPRPEEIS